MKELEGKRIKLILKTGRRYTGNVISYDNHLLKIVDKFGSIVYVGVEEIGFLEEVNDNGS